MVALLRTAQDLYSAEVISFFLPSHKKVFLWEKNSDVCKRDLDAYYLISEISGYFRYLEYRENSPVWRSMYIQPLHEIPPFFWNQYKNRPTLAHFFIKTKCCLDLLLVEIDSFTIHLSNTYYIWDVVILSSRHA